MADLNFNVMGIDSFLDNNLDRFLPVSTDQLYTFFCTHVASPIPVEIRA